VSILELIVDLLDGGGTTLAVCSLSPPIARLPALLREPFKGFDSPQREERPRRSFYRFRLFPTGRHHPRVPERGLTGTPQGERGPTLGVVDVTQIDPKFDDAAHLVDSLRMTDEAAWNASGSVDFDGHSISWIVGVATGPADPQHVLVLGTDGPMAYVILAFAEQDLEGVIRAMAGSFARAGR